MGIRCTENPALLPVARKRDGCMRQRTSAEKRAAPQRERHQSDPCHTPTPTSPAQRERTASVKRRPGCRRLVSRSYVMISRCTVCKYRTVGNPRIFEKVLRSNDLHNTGFGCSRAPSPTTSVDAGTRENTGCGPRSSGQATRKRGTRLSIGRRCRDARREIDGHLCVASAKRATRTRAAMRRARRAA